MFKTEEGLLTFGTTDLLSQNTSAGPSIGTPNIRSLYLNPSIISVAIRNSMNSEPMLDDSTVFWRLLYHMIGELSLSIIPQSYGTVSARTQWSHQALDPNS